MVRDPADAIACIVVAAGAGTRLGAGMPKALVDVGGTTMLERALEGVRAASQPMRIVVVAPAAHVEAVAAIAADATVVAGGIERQDSVKAGLEAAGTASIVLVHDAARLHTPPAVFDRVIEAVRAGAAGVVPVLPVVDTIRVADAASLGDVVDRSTLRAMQTPQGFDGDVLREAYARAKEARTDDAALVQAIGCEVVAVDGDERSAKVTTAADLDRVRGLAHETRVGIGTDVHRVVAGGPMWLAGLEWEADVHLEGHSDGDAVLHAIVDALLSAAGLGDIGALVGTDDPRFAGARSEVFVAAAVERLRERGWRPGNVAVQVVATSPRIGARRTEAEARMSALVGAPVSLSATTTDGLGFTGRGEGVQAIATAMVHRA